MPTIPLPAIPALDDPALDAEVRARIAAKTVPAGALGRLATLAARIATILGIAEPHLQAPQLLIYAADHGIAAQGVSAYPADVTAQMVDNFLAGGAVASVLARQHGIAQTVVDCGVCRTFDPQPGLARRKIAPGTQDSTQGPAMTLPQCVRAVENGIELLGSLPGNALLIGEMGIGNTSAASLLTARLLQVDVAQVTGAGTGLDDTGIARKARLLQRALATNAGARTPLAALAALGGFEIATMVGSILQAASERRVIVVDGFIASAAVLVADRMAPAVLQRCVFAHRSSEAGHTLLLQALGGQPLLDLALRVGEGSGAVLAWPLLVSACRILNEVASFASAGVTNRSTP